MILKLNMMYKIIFNSEKVIKKDIFKIPLTNRKKIFNIIEKLWENGLWNASIKKLNNYKLSDYRIRIWDYRVLFNIDEENKKIVIFRILHRSKLY